MAWLVLIILRQEECALISSAAWQLPGKISCRTLLGRLSLVAIPIDEAVQVVLIGPVAAKSLFIKQTLDAAAQAYLIAITLGPHRPTHLGMPAATKEHYAGPRQARSHQPQRPLPSQLLLLVAHLSTTCKVLKTKNITKRRRNAMAQMGWLTKDVFPPHLRAIRGYCESRQTTVTYTGQIEPCSR